MDETVVHPLNVPSRYADQSISSSSILNLKVPLLSNALNHEGDHTRDDQNARNLQIKVVVACIEMRKRSCST